MRIYLLLFSSFLTMTCFSQDALIVYALKGKANSFIDKKEAMIKIGSLLPVNSSVKLEEGTIITLLCKQGAQFRISKPGLHSLIKYKDSCRTKGNSVSSNYLAYLWGQFYANSADHKNEKHETNLAVSRGKGKQVKGKLVPGKRIIEFSRGMDTVKIADKDFQLCWNCFDMEGFYEFRLYDAKGIRVLVRDSSEESFISTSRFANKLITGKTYRWNISAPDAGIIKKRTLIKVKQEEIEALVSRLHNDSIIGEDSASFYFRIAFTLEQKHFLGEAWYYYQLASEADKKNLFIQQKFVQFRNEYYLPQ